MGQIESKASAEVPLHDAETRDANAHAEAGHVTVRTRDEMTDAGVPTKDGAVEKQDYTFERIVIPIDAKGEPVLDEATEKTLQSVDELMRRHLHDSEIDDPEVTMGAIAEGHLLVHVAKDSTGKVVALTSGSLTPMKDERGKMDKKNVFLGVWYIINEADATMVTKLTEELKKNAEDLAHKHKKNVVGGLTEAMHAEGFFGRHGMKRMYIKVPREQGDTAAGVRYQEVPYFQAPIEFDKNGEGIKWVEEKDKYEPFGTHDAPEHLMFVPSDPATKELSTNDVMNMVRGMWWYNSRENVPDDAKRGCKKRMGEIVDSYEAELAKALLVSTDAKIYLLTAAERKKMEREEGASFVHHRVDLDSEEISMRNTLRAERRNVT